MENLMYARKEYKVIGKCPICGADVIDKGKVCECRTNRYKKGSDGKFERTEGCGFKLWKTMCGRELSEGIIRELVENGETAEKINGFVSKKSGKEFSAKLKIREDHSVGFVFDEKPNEEPKQTAPAPGIDETNSDILPF